MTVNTRLSLSEPNFFKTDQNFCKNHPYQDFKKLFQLGSTSTEKENLETADLSSEMHRDGHQGLSLLLSQEKKVISGFKELAPQLDEIAPDLARKAKNGGRLIFVGVGSSGRAGVGLADVANQLCPGLNCVGFIGGGDCALIQAREGFEDSSEQGGHAAIKFELNANDTVILISASGSASFNAGFGHAAANSDATVYYFYNSEEIPERTQALFKRINNPVKPLLIDIGPQAILGSTRLQGFSIARVCLGYLLGRMAFHFDHALNFPDLSIDALSSKLESVLVRIEGIFSEILEIINLEFAAFSSAESNFRRIRDETSAGYVTFLGTSASMREIIVDTVETSPTFFLNPRRRILEQQKRRAEYQAYLVGNQDNFSAWKIVLGRCPYWESDNHEVQQFILPASTYGPESYRERPTGAGNSVIGVEMLRTNEKLSTELLAELQAVKKRGGTTALIVISEEPQPDLKNQVSAFCDVVAVIDDIKDDPLQLTFSQMLKWECNLISNGTMILMGKVLGNRMIDMRTSNNKLIDRCMRLTHELWEKKHPNEPLNDEELYTLILSIYEKQKNLQDQGEYTPSTMKMVLTILEKKLSFDQAIVLLREIGENIDRLYEGNK